MESASKRSRKKKEFSGLHPSLRAKVKKTNGFSNSAPVSPLFPRRLPANFLKMLTPGPGLSNPDLLTQKYLPAIIYSELDKSVRRH